MPTYLAIGIAAPILLITLRILQGLALGGEYGGAAIYVAEHAPANRRGFYTTFIQASVARGFLLSLLVVLATKAAVGAEAWIAWGWRIPFLFSIVLLAISLWMRLKLKESPVFRAMKEKGELARNPLKESFGTRRNIGLILVAMLGIAAGLTVIWYTAHYSALFFLQNSLRVDETVAAGVVGISVVISLLWFVLFGWLSDKVGRKKPIVIGYAATLLLLFPIFHIIADAANPALAEAGRRAPRRGGRAGLHLQPVRDEGPGNRVRALARLFLEKGRQLHQGGGASCRRQRGRHARCRAERWQSGPGAR